MHGNHDGVGQIDWECQCQRWVRGQRDDVVRPHRSVRAGVVLPRLPSHRGGQGAVPAALAWHHRRRPCVLGGDFVGVGFVIGFVIGFGISISIRHGWDHRRRCQSEVLLRPVRCHDHSAGICEGGDRRALDASKSGPVAIVSGIDIAIAITIGIDRGPRYRSRPAR